MSDRWLISLPFGDQPTLSVFQGEDGKYYTSHPLLDGPFDSLDHIRLEAYTLFRRRRRSNLVRQHEPSDPFRTRQDRRTGLTQAAVTEDTPSDKLVAGAAKLASLQIASAQVLQQPDVSSSKQLLDTTALEESITGSPQTVPHTTIDGSSSTFPSRSEELVAGVVESASALTLQESDGSSSEQLLDTTALEESITASPQTVPRSIIDGSSTFSPFMRDKLVAAASESASAQTLQEPDDSSSEKLIDTTLSEESFTANPQTVRHSTTDGSLPSAFSLGSKILFRSPRNWYEVFYIRMDREGSFWMYPDLGGGLFQSVDEAEDAINCYLDELRCRARCKEQDNFSRMDRMIYDCKHYLDGTPKKGPNSPSSKKSVDEKHYLVRALLDQYNEYHNLFGNLAHVLESLVTQQWIYEDQGYRWYYHFNFTTKKKEADDRITSNLFFAEVLQVKGKQAFEIKCCCMIEPNDSGHCYGCINNGSPGMKHPNSTDAYTAGHLDGYLPFGLESSSSDEEESDKRLRARLKGLDDPDIVKRMMRLTNGRGVITKRGVKV